MRIRRAIPDDRAFVMAAAPRLASFGPPPWRPPDDIVTGETRALEAFFATPPAGAALLVAESEEAGRLGFVYLERLQDYFKVEPQKTRIVFQVRVRFAGGHALKSGFRGAFWLTRPHPGAPVDRIEKVTEGCYVHSFLLRRPEDLSASLLRRLAEAYRVGCQEHLAGLGRRGSL